MRLPLILTIVRKELVETLRDRRTLLIMIGLPVIVYPLLMMFMSRLQEAQEAETEARASIVAVWGTTPHDLLTRASAPDAKVDLHPWRGAEGGVRTALERGTVGPAPPVFDDDGKNTPDARRTPRDTAREEENAVLAAARALLTAREADAVLVTWPGFDSAVDQGRSATTTVYFDSVRDDSRLARDRVVRVLEDFTRATLASREHARDLPLGFTTAVDLLKRDVAPAARRVGYVLGSFLPFLLVSLSLFGGFYAAVDLTAGEKERGTMQTLMCAPLLSTEIVVGKFVTIWAIALVAALANVSSLALTMSRIIPGGAVNLAPSAYAFSALLLVPITAITSALFLAVAAFARDFKDGQNFLTPVYMVLAMPAGVTMLPGVELNAWTAFVPVVNIALLVKAVFSGELRTDLVFLVLVSSAIYATLAILLAARVFAREQILLGGRESAARVLGLERRSGGTPGPSVALTTFALAMVLAFYASLLIEQRGLVTMLLVTQYGFFLLPALVVVFGLGYSARDTLALRAPSWQAVLAGLALGSTAWLAIAGIVLRVAPPPDSLVKALQKLLMLGDVNVPLWAVILLVAVTPAICEELFFRGVVLSGLRPLGPWTAIGVSSLLFAIAHASIYRLLPTLLLGIVLGYAVWRTGSILTSMIVHAVNNGLAAWLSRDPSASSALGSDPSAMLPPIQWTIPATVVTIAALWWLSRSPARPAEGAPNTGEIRG